MSKGTNGDLLYEFVPRDKSRGTYSAALDNRHDVASFTQLRRHTQRLRHTTFSEGSPSVAVGMWRRSLDGSYVIACVVARRKQLEVFHLGDGTRNRSCLSRGWKSTSKLFTLGLPNRSFLSWGWKRNNRTRTIPQSRYLNRRTSHVRRSETTVRE